MTEFLTLVDIGHMHLDNGYLYGGNCVPDCIAVVSVCTCIQDYSRKIKACGVNAVDYLALAVGLEALALGKFI